MTIYCLTEELAIRVGPQGIWIWAPSVSPQPIHLDRRQLEEMGISLVTGAPPLLSGGRVGFSFPSSTSRTPDSV